MTDFEVSHLCDGKKLSATESGNLPQIRRKILSVVNKPYQKTYTPGINIQGEYLRKYGFEKGDKVEVLLEQNRIQISKIIESKEDELSR